MNTSTPVRTVASRPASAKQIGLIRRLAAERSANLLQVEQWDTLQDVLTGREEWVAMHKASALIDALFDAPRNPAPEAAKAAPGYYVREDEVFVVVENKAKTGTYAKRLVVAKGWDGRTRAWWEYAPSVGRSLAAEGLAPLTADEVGRLGHLHGVCVVCCKALTDPESVTRGIGPVCRKRLGG